MSAFDLLGGRLRIRQLSSVVLVAALAAGLAACGGSSTTATTVPTSSDGKTKLTIYSSLPLGGAPDSIADAVLRGEKLAFKELAPTAEINGFEIQFVSLFSSSPESPGASDPAQVVANARKAAQDKTTAFYLGELGSGDTQSVLPILNYSGIPQISSTNTYPGLTTTDPGTKPGEPEEYYPSGTRTYARIVPRDTIQAAAMVWVMREDGCKSLALWDNMSVYGAGLARDIELSAKLAGIDVVDRQGVASGDTSIAAKAAAVSSDCFAWAGTNGSQGTGVAVFDAVGSTNPNIKLYGPDGLATGEFTNPAQGGISPAIAPRVKITNPNIGLSGLNLGLSPLLAKDAQLNPYEVYGYEAMALALDTIKRAGKGANDRAQIVKTLFSTKDRKSVLGTYSIDPSGDTTITDYGLYVVKAGMPSYSRTIKLDPSLLAKR
ncbi:MAG: branched-chain amino acid ABC transporter substrate-binding protein [Actinomycetota bacterium]